MWWRTFLFLVTVFWGVMTVLLWQSEFGGGKKVGSHVSAAVVWNKVLTSPDVSSLTIYHKKKKIGFCRWAATIGELKPNTNQEPFAPEGLVTEFKDFALNVEGNVVIDEFNNRARFEMDLKLTTNHAWQEFHLRITIRPDAWEIHSVAAEQSLVLKGQDPDGNWEKVFKFAELKNPDRLVQEVAGPVAWMFLGSLGLPQSSKSLSGVSLGLKWEARNDFLQLGHSQVRVYRLETKFFDRFPIVLIVSRVGEILRLELPHNLHAVNEAFSSM